jgi:hypothetical protein
MMAASKPKRKYLGPFRGFHRILDTDPPALEPRPRWADNEDTSEGNAFVRCR